MILPTISSAMPMLRIAGICGLVFMLYRFVVAYYQWLTSPLRKIPGPGMNSFALGEFFPILREPFLNPHKRWWKEALAKAKNEGSSVPMMAYSTLFGRSSVIILDPDIVKTILTEPSSRDPVRFSKKYLLLRNLLGDGLVTLEGADWSRHRRIIQPSFNTGFLKEALSISVPKRTEAFLSSWRKAKPGREIDLASHMSALTLDIIGDVAFSHDFQALQVLDKWARDDSNDELDSVSDPLVEALTNSFKVTPTAVILTILKISWPDKYLNRTSQRASTVLNQAVDSIIREAREKVNADSSKTTFKPSLLQLLFDAKDAEPGTGRKTLDDSELRDEIKTFLVAGHETTSTWCYWALYALAEYPDVQQKVYDDIVKHAPDSSAPIDLESVEQMTYFLAFLNEVLRLYAPVGFVIRNTTQQEEWKGFTIPSGIRLVIPFHLLHRHPDHWSNPLMFTPERWLNNEETDARHKFCYLPFSAGGRNCIGQRFAQIEANLILANIIRAFSIQLAPSLRDKEVEFTSFGTMKGKPAVKICVKAR
jgi:cytochrome P450